jgi:Protein of unknown function (DUF3800)
MALFNAYIDESYTDGDDPAILVVGGYLMRADEAERMEANWQRILAKHGVTYFHMTDVNAASGDFKHLEMTGCDALAREIIGSILSHDVEGFSAIINLRKAFSMQGGASDLYASGLDACVTALTSNLSQKDPDAKIMFYFEDGHASQGIADKYLKKLPWHPQGAVVKHFLDHKFCGKKEKCLLQAADVLVWQTARFIKDKYKRTYKNATKVPRLDYLALAEKPTLYHYLFVYRGMPELHPVPANAALHAHVDLVFRRMFDTSALLTYFFIPIVPSMKG